MVSLGFSLAPAPSRGAGRWSHHPQNLASAELTLTLCRASVSLAEGWPQPAHVGDIWGDSPLL